MTSDSIAPDLVERLEFAEAEAYVDMFRVAPPELGLRVERVGGAVCLLAPSLPIILFNRVVGPGLREPAADATVAEIAGLYQAAGISRWGVQLSPFAQPPALSGWLAARGLPRRDNWAKVYRAAAPPPRVATDLTVTSVGRDGAQAWAGVAVEGFEMPPFLGGWLAASVGEPGWRHYLAWDGETPAAAAALYIWDNVGWLGIEATRPAYRRRGAQGALIARSIADAVDLGCRWLVAETDEDTAERPNPSYHNMLRAGFSLAYLRPNYIAGA
ncbi:MAG: GNAT family N-acetyltransferase [Anaerolineae bacterium]